MKKLYGDTAGRFGIDWSEVVYLNWDGGSSFYLLFRGSSNIVHLNLPNVEPKQIALILQDWTKEERDGHP